MATYGVKWIPERAETGRVSTSSAPLLGAAPGAVPRPRRPTSGSRSSGRTAAALLMAPCGLEGHEVTLASIGGCAAATGLLLEALEALPVQQSAALYVVQVADDPRSSARDVGLGIAGDPVLTARVRKLGDSAYGGLSGRVSRPDFVALL